MTSPSVAAPDRPLRVAVVGAGPAGFYTVEALLKQADVRVDVDLFERLPAPYGLLRYGVAPDHPKIKSVSTAYDRLCERSEVRYLGNVPVGQDDAAGLSVDDLALCYDQVVFTTGCETDRHLGIPGENLRGSHGATQFVGWYNGHPDFTALDVDLDVERAVVVGIGDVAMDLARVLLRDPDELAGTDIADYALEALRRSRVREVVILARRGPAEAAFAAKELEDIGAIPGLAVTMNQRLVEDALATPDSLSANLRHKLEVLSRLAAAAPEDAKRRLDIRFLASPVEILGDGDRVSALRWQRNRLVTATDGRFVAEGTGRMHELETGLVLRSVGYLGVPIAGLPFDRNRCVVPNLAGRVCDERGVVRPGLYVAGWIKRGASGVVGTNKGDAAATVTRMVEDAARVDRRGSRDVSRAAIDAKLAARGVRVVDWEGWKRIDRCERERGAAAGKVREKLTSIDELLAAAGA